MSDDMIRIPRTLYKDLQRILNTIPNKRIAGLTHGQSTYDIASRLDACEREEKEKAQAQATAYERSKIRQTLQYIISMDGDCDNVTCAECPLSFEDEVCSIPFIEAKYNGSHALWNDDKATRAQERLDELDERWRKEDANVK